MHKSINNIQLLNFNKSEGFDGIYLKFDEMSVFVYTSNFLFDETYRQTAVCGTKGDQKSSYELSAPA